MLITNFTKLSLVYPILAPSVTPSSILFSVLNFKKASKWFLAAADRSTGAIFWGHWFQYPSRKLTHNKKTLKTNFSVKKLTSRAGKRLALSREWQCRQNSRGWRDWNRWLCRTIFHTPSKFRDGRVHRQQLPRQMSPVQCWIIILKTFKIFF